MYYVYILRSTSNITKTYIGVTENLEKRLQEHAHPNKGAYTCKYAPWGLETCIGLASKRLALGFEKYLKTGLGRAFIKRHFIT